MRGKEPFSGSGAFSIREIPPHARRREISTPTVGSDTGNTSACAEKSIEHGSLNGKRTLGATYPRNGKGVVKNTSGGKVEVGLDLSVIRRKEAGT